MYINYIYYLIIKLKGKYGTKSDYITVLKNGCMLIELIPK